MKPILFSVQNAHSTPFTRGIERHMEVNGQHFVQIDYDHRKTNILIQDGIAGYMCNGLQVHGKHATLRHFRYEKHVYNNLFNDLAKEHKLRGWRPVLNYADSFAIPVLPVCAPVIDYLVRPNYGARGLGFIQFPYPKTTANALETLVKKWTAEEITDEFFQGILKKIGAKISDSPNTKMEEVKSCLKDGFDFVKVVSDVSKEYRIITDHLGAPALLVEREQLDYGLKIKQASGGYQNTDKIIPVDDFFSSVSADFAKELKRFFELVKLPIHSFDLFITRDGNWGFFEACNEFGCTTVPDGFVRKETGLLLSHIAKQLQIK